MSISAFFTVRAYKGYSSSLHSHPQWEIVFSEDKGGTIEYNGKIMEYKPRAVLVYPPNVPHKQTSHGNGIHWCMCVSGYEADGFKEGIYSNDKEVGKLFKVMALELKEKRPLYKAFLEADAAKISLMIKRLSAGKAAVPAEDERLKKVKKLLDENFDKTIDLSELTGALLLSKEYLRQVFKKEYGVTPVRYIIQKRIEKAKSLLSQKRLTVKEIAAICGFEDEYYFSRLFKKVTGIAPIKYKRDAK